MSNDLPKQLTLDLTARPAFGRDDFLVAPSNQLAAEFVDRWPDWPSSTALLIGPAGVGKTHLVEIWRRRSGARVVDIASLQEDQVPSLIPPKGSIAVENAPGPDINQKALFHLLNQARENEGFVLMTSRMGPRNWNLTLQDLISRLVAAPTIYLNPAEETLVRGVLVKLFADRQIGIDEGLVEYLMTRMPRSLAAARLLVAAIDAEALEKGSGATRVVAARVLADLTASGAFNEESA